jgi:hypothetical protein
MEQIVRRGRVKGFIPWLISQRPAVLNKNVLSQVDGLIAFKLTASQDRNALDAWIEGRPTRREGLRSRTRCRRCPGRHRRRLAAGRGMLETVNFPLKMTFDSSRDAEARREASAPRIEAARSREAPGTARIGRGRGQGQ